MVSQHETYTTVQIKNGEYIGASGILTYLQEAGEQYGLPRLTRVNHVNKITPLRENHGFPDPVFHFSGRDAWLLSAVEKWVAGQREKEVQIVLESTKTLTTDQLHALYEELGKQIGGSSRGS